MGALNDRPTISDACQVLTHIIQDAQHIVALVAPVYAAWRDADADQRRQIHEIHPGLVDALVALDNDLARTMVTGIRS